MAATIQTTKSQSWKGQGPILWGDYDPATGTKDMAYMVNVEAFPCGNRTLSTTLTKETSTIKESCSGQRLDLEEIAGPAEMTFTLELQHIAPRLLAHYLYGVAVDKAAGTVTAETLPTVAAGDNVFLRHPNASSIVIEDSTSGTPIELVEDTHYEIKSPEHSHIKILALPTSPDAVQPFKVDYAHAAYVNIAAFTQANAVRKGIVFNGINHNGRKARLIMPCCSMVPGGDYNWLSDEPITMQFTGRVLYASELGNDPEYGNFARVDWLD
ncbi:hypothetical protein ACN9MJ_10600 [Acidovorax facilis]|uniref:phage tail tube protein n=1 Tax=Acidovorax facilis TaxID=12917 RepID=UPI003CEC08DE